MYIVSYGNYHVVYMKKKKKKKKMRPLEYTLTYIDENCVRVLRYTLHRISRIRRSVSRQVLQSRIVFHCLTRLDYGCTTLAGLPTRYLDRLQLAPVGRHGNDEQEWTLFVLLLLVDLHWLRVRQLTGLVYRCLRTKNHTKLFSLIFFVIMMTDVSRNFICFAG